MSSESAEHFAYSEKNQADQADAGNTPERGSFYGDTKALVDGGFIVFRADLHDVIAAHSFFARSDIDRNLFRLAGGQKVDGAFRKLDSPPGRSLGIQVNILQVNVAVIDDVQSNGLCFADVRIKGQAAVGSLDIQSIGSGDGDFEILFQILGRTGCLNRNGIGAGFYGCRRSDGDGYSLRAVAIYFNTGYGSTGGFEGNRPSGRRFR